MIDDPNQETDRMGLFLYGIVPSDVTPTPDAQGIGDPPTEVTTVRRDGLAALVSKVDLTTPIGRPGDLVAYQRLLDDTAAVAPVLPVRFGTVLSDEDGVGELLDVHHDRFSEGLDGVSGTVQYTVHGRFEEAPLVGGFLEENPPAAALADQVRGLPEVEGREQRIQLGEMISQAVELRRDAETRELIDAVGQHAVANVPGQPGHELDAMNVSFLVRTDKEEAFIDAVEDFSDQRHDLIRMRLVGPLAPYDFASSQQLVE